MKDLCNIAQKLANLTMGEAKELMSILENDYNIKKINPYENVVHITEIKEESGQVEFEVYMLSSGMRKLQVIKAVKEFVGLGLKDSKELVDSAPCTIQAGIRIGSAEQLKTELENVGATIEIK